MVNGSESHSYYFFPTVIIAERVYKGSQLGT